MQAQENRDGGARKTVLLIGANGGVGLSIMRQLLDTGHYVIPTVSREEKLLGFRADFPDANRTFVLGLDNADLIADKLAAGIGAEDRLDAAIFCPAVAPFSAMETLPLAALREAFEVNLLSALAVFQAVLPKLRASQGRMIFVGSLSGRVAAPTMGGYVSSKFALEGLIDTMRQEVDRLGVKVILLQPGSIATPMVETSVRQLNELIGGSNGTPDETYRDLYEMMRDGLQQQRESGSATSPDVVASAAMEALIADAPRSRYPVGADAHALIEASRTKSDEEIDAIVMGYRSI